MQSERLPSWIRAPLPSRDYGAVRELLKENSLTTVCREAHCPNLSECWSAGTATIMLLGEKCTRRCSFCAVGALDGNGQIDVTEPERVAKAVHDWGLRYVVLTMVARDDLDDHGAHVLSEIILEIRRRSPRMMVEMLASDLGGSARNLDMVLGAHPEVFAHNVETTRRLTPSVRARQASYERSLGILEEAKKRPVPARITKSSLMLGLGEEREEVLETLSDLREAGVDVVTMGQYLRPGGSGFLAVERYVPPGEFAELGRAARQMGFKAVASGPLVRPSYMAEELYRSSVAKGG